ncbi:MAG: DJ-1/PfpI family protein [Planctomycetota bacterium]|jgi:transcriptional regulator GlxA family with amidase domain
MKGALLLLALALTTGCGRGDDDVEWGRMYGPDDPWVQALALPGSGNGGKLNVAFLIVDGVYNTELTAPMDIFHHTVFHDEVGMAVFTVAPSLEPVTSFEGLRLLPDHSFTDHPPVDILVVPSAEHSMDTDLENQAMIAWVAETAVGARAVMSLCDGAFVLAGAGLLDGRHATTFPADIERLEEMFPEVFVHRGHSFVHDKKIITSFGGARSFEPALYVCERLYGKQAADGIAAGMVIDWDLDAVEHTVDPPTILCTGL